MIQEYSFCIVAGLALSFRRFCDSLSSRPRLAVWKRGRTAAHRRRLVVSTSGRPRVDALCPVSCPSFPLGAVHCRRSHSPADVPASRRRAKHAACRKLNRCSGRRPGYRVGTHRLGGLSPPRFGSSGPPAVFPPPPPRGGAPPPAARSRSPARANDRVAGLPGRLPSRWGRVLKAKSQRLDASGRPLSEPGRTAPLAPF